MAGVHPWLIWLILAAALAAAETASLDLVLIMCAAGAGSGAIAAAAHAPAPAQVTVAVIVALGGVFLVRPVAKRHLLGQGTTRDGTDALVGTNAVVLRRVDAQDGRVKLNGGEWSARAFDTAQVIEAGTTVQVMQIKGATAVVWETPA